MGEVRPVPRQAMGPADGDQGDMHQVVIANRLTAVSYTHLTLPTKA